MIKKAKVIAELGINHKGHYEILIELADMAMENGADFVKIQKRTPRLCVPKDQWMVPKTLEDGTETTYIEYREIMEFDINQLRMFDEYMKTKYGDRKWSASVWDTTSLKVMASFDVPWIKIPSALITKTSLMKAAARFCWKRDIPLIFSTGGSTEQQIYRAYGTAQTYNAKTVVMHCNSTYPTPDEDVNLRTMVTLNEILPEAAIGFSSHSKDPEPAKFAALMGAKWIEQHVTLDRTWWGSDHAASLERGGLRRLCRDIARIPVLYGDGKIRVYPSEHKIMQKLRG